jgi:hypothetical protein
VPQLAGGALGLLLARRAREAGVQHVAPHAAAVSGLAAGGGALLAAALPPRARAAVARWNAHGIAGLVAVAVTLAVLMVPRVLDLALRRPDHRGGQAGGAAAGRRGAAPVVARRPAWWCRASFWATCCP